MQNTTLGSKRGCQECAEFRKIGIKLTKIDGWCNEKADFFEKIPAGEQKCFVEKVPKARDKLEKWVKEGKIRVNCYSCKYCKVDEVPTSIDGIDILQVKCRKMDPDGVEIPDPMERKCASFEQNVVINDV